MGLCNYSIFCCALLCVHSSIAIILMGKRELVALLILSSMCLKSVVWLFPAMPWVCLQFVIVVFPDHTHSLFLVGLGSETKMVPIHTHLFLWEYIIVSPSKCLIKAIDPTSRQINQHEIKLYFYPPVAVIAICFKLMVLLLSLCLFLIYLMSVVFFLV